MRRTPWLMLLALMFLPHIADAIQLHWSTGATDVSVSENTRVMLVVQADSDEVTLPESWRLQWTADSSGLQASAPDSLTACLVDTAKVEAIDPPLTPADSASNQLTA